MAGQEHSRGPLLDDLAFRYRVCAEPGRGKPDMVVLHGSGVDETTLVPLAWQAVPTARLFAVRGRIPQDDGWRWFERITPTSFGQDSIKTEAAAFAAFIADLSDRRGLRPDSAVFLGYSNGANLISSVMLLHPGIIRQAILLRAMPVIEAPPPTDLGGTRVLVVRGRKDVTYGPFSPALIALLRTRGAKVTARTVGFGHEVGEPDARLIQSWLGRAAHPDESSGDAPRIG